MAGMDIRTPTMKANAPLGPKDPLEAIAELLGLNAGPAIGEQGQPSVPAPDGQMPRGMSSEVPTPQYGYSGGAAPTQGEMSSPFERQNAADLQGIHAADSKRNQDMQALSDFFIPDNERRRDEELSAKLAPVRESGNTARDVARINAEGGIEQQRIASEGVIGAAQARGTGTAGGRLPSGLMERVAGANTALSTLSELEPLIEDPSFLGGIGPAAGRFNQFLQGIPGAPSNENFNKINARSATLANATIKAITGAQMSEPEAKRIMMQIPTSHDRPDVWKSKAQAMRSNLTNTIDNIQNQNSGGGVGAGGGLSRDRLVAMAQSLGLDLGADDMTGDLDQYTIEVQ